MIYHGQVKNGVVVFDNGSPPEGTLVRIEPLEAPGPGKSSVPARDDKSVWDALLRLAGTVEGLPPDASRQHDHYLYGTPKTDE